MSRNIAENLAMLSAAGGTYMHLGGGLPNIDQPIKDAYQEVKTTANAVNQTVTIVAIAAGLWALSRIVS